jgi:2-haloacid dehalogenase
LRKRFKTPPEETWLVSANSWDVIGAKSAGIRAAWVKRNSAAMFDPWGIEPDVVVSDLEALADYFGG